MIDYYTILTQTIAENTAEFSVELRADCPVYAGHFPGNPIAPGACSIEMVRECASIAMQRELRFAGIKQCKFLRLMKPGSTAQISLKWENDRLKATIINEGEPAVQLNIVVS